MPMVLDVCAGRPIASFVTNRPTEVKRSRLNFSKRPQCACKAAPVEVTVVGGGAAGLTAAYFAASSGAKVTSPIP